jgi:hypothetical protein
MSDTVNLQHARDTFTAAQAQRNTALDRCVDLEVANAALQRQIHLMSDENSRLHNENVDLRADNARLIESHKQFISEKAAQTEQLELSLRDSADVSGT